MTNIDPPGFSVKDARLIAGFCLLNAVVRLMAARLNQGEYTDGILQITQFDNPSAFWPPLYTALVWPLTASGLDALWAGRLVSVASAVALVPAVWMLACDWSGRRAAFFAALLYTAAPLALRWSGRVMTDMLFTCLFTWAVWGWLRLWQGLRQTEPRAPRTPRFGTVALAVTAVAVSATLTRYQGFLMLPPLLWVTATAWRRRLPGRTVALSAQALWLLVFAWIAWGRFAHTTQVASRQGQDLWSTLLNYWYVFEMFLYLTPYALTLPVFVFLLVGLIRGPLGCDHDTSRSIPFRLFFAYSALAILAAQSVFQSFQTRYLLPLLPMALVIAGGGMARLEAALAGNGAGRGGLHRRLETALIGGTMAWSALFALAVAVLQAGAFGDIFAAGRFLAANDAIGPDAVCYSNETFAGGMDGAKLAFASGREVRLPPELMAAADSSALARAFGIDKPPAAPGFMEPGSVLALHTAYGGPAGVLGLLNAMARRYTLKPLDRNAAEALARIGAPTGETEDISEGFESWLVPLLPDIMEEPITHQNPLAWLLRYRRQDFATWLFVIREIKAGESPGG